VQITFDLNKAEERATVSAIISQFEAWVNDEPLEGEKKTEPAVMVATDVVLAPTPVPVAEAKKVTLEDVKLALAAFAQKNGIPKAQELLAEFEAKNAATLKPEQYPAFIAKAAV
jgi:hypothetical protein